MMRPAFFIWIIAPIALYLVYAAWGLPHIAFNYKFRNDGQGQDPFVNRWYLSCTYEGSYGTFIYRPTDGKCPWFRFYKKQEQINAT